MRTKLIKLLTVLISAVLLLTACGKAAKTPGGNSAVQSTTTGTSFTDAATTIEMTATAAITETTVTGKSTTHKRIIQPTQKPTTQTKVPVRRPAVIQKVTSDKDNVNTNTTIPTIPTKVTTPVDVPVTEDLKPINPTDYYGRKQLAGLKNQNLLRAYERIVSAAESYVSAINLSDLSLNEFEVAKVFNYYIDDYPQHFWLDKGYQIQGVPQNGITKVKYLIMQYAINKDEITARRKKVDDSVEQLLKGINGDTEPFDRVKIVHDRLVNLVTYDLSTKNPYDLYGAIINGEAVCEGYARAFQRLMYKVGVPCLIVKGSSRDIPHAWNLVYLDGEWYHIDATWNDAEVQIGTATIPYIDYSYFNITDQQIRIDHEVSRDYYIIEEDGKPKEYPNILISYELPAATGTAMNYFVKTGRNLETPSVTGIKNIMVQASNNGEKSVSIRIDSEMNLLTDSMITKAFSAFQKETGKKVYSEYIQDETNKIIIVFFK